MSHYIYSVTLPVIRITMSELFKPRVPSLNTYSKVLVHLLLGGLLTCQFSACKTIKPPPPKLEYFISKDSIYPMYLDVAVPHISIIQKGDILGIIVSSLNKEANETFNFYNVSSLPVTTFTAGSGGASSQPIGYPVDLVGEVSIPLIGKQKLEGLSLQQAEEKIRARVEQTLKEPTVNIRFMNHKFTVLGEVGQVGIFNLLNDHTTIIEALTVAGDLTVYGKRDSVKVIRAFGGRREIGMVSLRNREVFTSPYFYVRNDDIIYVEPTKEKVIPVTPEQPGLFVQRAPLYLSIVSTLLSLIFIVTRL